MQAKSDPRERFFNEEGDCIPPFTDQSWRGCCLNRDRFDATMMPRFLFEALVAATGTKVICAYFYTGEQPPALGVAPDWESFRTAVKHSGNESLEHVVFDSSGSWAVLGELDVVVLGASPEVADRIDSELKQHGTSLALMTVWDYEGTCSEDPRYSYMRAVIGGSPTGAP